MLDPGLRKLFKSDLAQQGRKLMSMLGTAIANLDRLESVAPVVRDLGRRHAGYGVGPTDYDTVAGALIVTLEQGLGNDSHQRFETQARLSRVLRTINGRGKIRREI